MSTPAFDRFLEQLRAAENRRLAAAGWVPHEQLPDLWFRARDGRYRKREAALALADAQRPLLKQRRRPPFGGGGGGGSETDEGNHPRARGRSAAGANGTRRRRGLNDG